MCVCDMYTFADAAYTHMRGTHIYKAVAVARVLPVSQGIRAEPVRGAQFESI